ncbi:MAG: tetratricopeptide repeat protein, partial [Phycisphaerae bacterium]|nr:tetratricopeptide repeat protein [Phycisphaerae bacterium]
LSQRNQTDQARTLLDRAIQADPDNRDLQRWRKLLDASPDERYNIELEFASQEPDPLARALEKYRIALQYGRQDDARKYIHEAETIDAANERVIMGLYQLAIRNKQWDRAQELVGRLRDQGSPNWRVLQARLKLMQEDTDGAIQDLETALQEGERQDVRLLLGEAYRAKGNYDEAKRHFLAAWDNNRRLVAAMKGLAQVAAAQERWGDHEKWIVRAWDEPQGKADPYISNRHLELVTERQNPAEAIRAREKRYQSNPNDLANVWRLAQLYEMEQRFDKAGEMYQQGFQKTGNLVWASALAMHYARADQTAKADDIFRNLAKNVTDPQEQARVYIAWGQHLSRINESEAEHMFDKAIELASDAAFPYAAKADFLTNRARRLRTRGNDAEAKTLYADAVEMLETSLRQDGQNLARKRQLHLRQIDAGAYDEAITGFQQMLENNADDIQARVGLGRALMMKRDYDAARLQFNRAIQSDRTHADAHRSLAELYQRQGELADAFQALENAVRNAPDNIHLQMGLAQLYASAGQTNDAANAYLRVIENNPRYRPAYEGVISLLRRDRRQWKNALQWAQEARETFPSDLDFLVIEASIHRDLRQWPQVVDSYRRALDIDPGNHALTREYLTAVLATRDGQALQAAIKQYQDREDLAGVIQAVRAAWQAQQGTAAEQVIPQFVEALKNARDNADILAIWAVMADAVDFRPLAENMPTIVSADERNWRLNRLAGQTLAQPGPEAGYFPQAEEWYRRALALAGTRDDRLDVLRHMAILYEQGRNTAQYGQEYLKKAQQTYQDMLAIDRDDIVACNNLAYLYTDVLDQPKKALELIERALAHRPASRNLIDTHAWALAKAGQYDRAERKLKEIINRSGDRPSPDYLYHLGFVKEKQGAKNEARGYYKQAIQAIDRLGDQEDNPLRQKVFDALQRVTDTSS